MLENYDHNFNDSLINKINHDTQMEGYSADDESLTEIWSWPSVLAVRTQPRDHTQNGAESRPVPQCGRSSPSGSHIYVLLKQDEIIIGFC